jgi:hypothetical protein
MTETSRSTKISLATALALLAGQTAFAQTWPLGSVAPNTGMDSAEANYCTTTIGPSSFVTPSKTKVGVLVMPLFQTGPTCTPFCDNPVPLLEWSGAAHLAFSGATNGTLNFDYYFNQNLVNQGTPSLSFTNYATTYNKTTGGLTVKMMLTPSTSSCSVPFQATYYKP